MIINSENHTVLMHEDDYRKIMQFKTERDSLIDDLTWYKAKVDRLEREKAKLKDDLWCTEGMLSIADNQTNQLQHENKRLTRLTHKLTTHRTMWDNLKEWRRDMLEIDKNDTQLIGLGLVMDELEHNWLYGERADDER